MRQWSISMSRMPTALPAGIDVHPVQAIRVHATPVVIMLMCCLLVCLQIVAVTFCNIHSTDAECCETGRRDAEHKYALIRAVRLSFASSQGKYARGQQRSRSVIVVSCQGQCALACSVGTQLSRTYLKLLATRPCHILAIAMLACMSVGMHAMVLT